MRTDDKPDDDDCHPYSMYSSITDQTACAATNMQDAAISLRIN